MLASVAASITATASAAISVATSAVEPTGFASVITTIVPGIIASALPSAVTTTLPVTATIVKVPMLYELTAAFVGGLSGATRAAEKRMDISGVAVLAVVNALGGGILRDVLLQTQGIAAFQHWRLLAVALAAAVVGFFFSSLGRRLQRPFLYLDALSLGLFAIVGADKALLAGLTVVPAVLLGVVTSVGGGVIRDVLCNETPQVLKPGTLSGTAAALGSTLYVLLVTWMHIVKPVALVVAVLVTVTLRIVSVKRGWTAPEPVDYTAVPERLWGATRGAFSMRGRPSVDGTGKKRSPSRRS
ncbi:MAG: TRIC cation channel family protein [Actinomycetota bacterium]|nr:MAG: hypothetical protein FD171_140 [Actinomycetota bacterium]MDO8950607.1 TRIC cation channel family protein [Actinomycetota bacterium]MDP3629535.1 TRIC cation channel family protein [Actinomycetota bacterium]